MLLVPAALQGAVWLRLSAATPTLLKGDRRRYMSFVMSVAQSACEQPPSDAAASSADTSSSTGAAAPSNHQQQQQYPSSAELAKVLAGANSAEGNLRSRAAITALFADLGSFQLAGELQRQAKSSELQRCCWDVITGLDDWEGGIQALAAGAAPLQAQSLRSLCTAMVLLCVHRQFQEAHDYMNLLNHHHHLNLNARH